MNNILIRLEDILLKIGNVMLFHHFNLSIPEGKLTVIIGPSGAGKSLILKLAAGILIPHQGKVFFRDQDWNIMNSYETIATRSKIGFVFQNAALWSNKSLYQNLELPLAFHHPDLSRRQIQERIEQFCSLISFTNNLELRPSQISLGEQKQIAFLRAYCIMPEVLFLDDAIASLDSASKERIISILSSFKQQGYSAVMITQDPAVIAQLADYLIVLKKGKILEQGDFDIVIKSRNPEAVPILSSILNQVATYSYDNSMNLLSDNSL